MGEDFILYRLPDTQEIWLCSLSTDSEDGAKFVFHSFDNKQTLLFTLTHRQKFSYTSWHNFDLELQLSSLSDIEVMTKDTYLNKCNLFINALRQSDFQKLILSRIKLMKRIENPKNKFLQLCKKYPSAFVYLTHFDGQTWMGASPERLVQVVNNQLKTVALAGTKAVADKREWTLKEQEEHQMVVDYIMDNLQELNPTTAETETIRLGAIEHLQTPIKG